MDIKRSADIQWTQFFYCLKIPLIWKNYLCLKIVCIALNLK